MTCCNFTNLLMNKMQCPMSFYEYCILTRWMEAAVHVVLPRAFSAFARSLRHSPPCTHTWATAYISTAITVCIPVIFPPHSLLGRTELAPTSLASVIPGAPSRAVVPRRSIFSIPISVVASFPLKLVPALPAVSFFITVRHIQIIPCALITCTVTNFTL